jgi:hypothetical protein
MDQLFRPKFHSSPPGLLRFLVLGVNQTDAEWKLWRDQLVKLINHYPIHIMFYRHGELDDPQRQIYLKNCEIATILCGEAYRSANKNSVDEYLLQISSEIDNHLIPSSPLDVFMESIEPVLQTPFVWKL